MTNLRIEISRRAALLGAGAAAVGSTAGGILPVAAAQSAAQGSVAPSASYQVGDFKVATLLDGAVTAGEPQKTFGMNQSAEDFAAASAENFIPADAFKAFFTPTVVDTGSDVILFDTGVGEGGRPARGNMRAALAGAGYTPEQVTVVVITHMHPDHIGGMMEAGAAAFPNARYVTGRVEYDFWSKMDPESNGVAKLVDSNVKPFSEKLTFLDDGGSVASGVTAISAFGHTPGHMIYLLESGPDRLVLMADTANHYVWSLAYPDWEVRFDMDKEAAAKTRRMVFDMLAAEKTPFVGYHMPFPAVGYVEKRDSGFRYVPASYQFQL
ncbi:MULTISPECIES: MBL fold metallo-hydrolase [Pseudovibrio]|uniref:MBL fold metallo-hydrolase n=1 Tax=Stappiaceae TaxID=2821832 RepID=UPI002366557D|nr:MULTISPECIES: MBL fold metallo-hydrolase [Pseudovibrio]MDD7911947.1 MBL fold metallo-hydrolase [Pseudovibrio exalbescens]MDX5595387.1 MBL fold metallo-hydrolase [Pseudovibrio sp. SPO723]